MGDDDAFLDAVAPELPDPVRVEAARQRVLTLHDADMLVALRSARDAAERCGAWRAVSGDVSDNAASLMGSLLRDGLEALGVALDEAEAPERRSAALDALRRRDVQRRRRDVVAVCRDLLKADRTPSRLDMARKGLEQAPGEAEAVRLGKAIVRLTGIESAFGKLSPDQLRDTLANERIEARGLALKLSLMVGAFGDALTPSDVKHANATDRERRLRGVWEQATTKTQSG